MPQTSPSANWTLSAFRFVQKHFLLIFSLGLLAGVGRATQLGAFGAIPNWLHFVLECLIEASRLVIFLFCLGLTNVRTGIRRFLKLLSPAYHSKDKWSAAFGQLRRNWLPASVNVIAFMVFAFLINLLIDQLAYETCLYANLQNNGVMDAGASEWTIILFFKNITVIPFTLVFNAVLLLWFANKKAESVAQVQQSSHT
jgi:hypothetical protein